MKLKTIKNLNLKGKKVLVRVNFDLPLKNGKILDDSRIKTHLPTIFYLIRKRAKVILISHLDDPQKIKNKELRIKNYGLRSVAEYINNSRFKIQDLRLKIGFIDDCLGEKVKKEIEKLKPGEVILLENLRFYPSEEKNDKKFAKFLANLAEIYINDAFPVCHRNHASVSAITKYLPSYAGFLLEKEVKNLSEILEKPKHPFIVLVGGAKISTKLPVIKNLLKIADKILIGGALANNFFAAQGLNISQSIHKPEIVKEANKILKNKIVLPVNVRIKIKNLSPRLTHLGREKLKVKNIEINKLNNFKKEKFKILDIGPETINLFAHYLKSARMIVWNGPMGLFEEKEFRVGTDKLAREIFKNKKAKVVIGGGDTLASLKQSRTYADLTRTDADRVFISTGGGAMLEFLAGKILPGIKPLIINHK